jgi:TonB family protein
MVLKAIGVICLVLSCSSAAVGMRESSTARLATMTTLEKQADLLWAAAFRDAGFSSITDAQPRVTCENTAVPEPLATPEPLLADGKPGARIVISFIIGTDGQVHSPLILQSSDEIHDSILLTAVRSWKFRPATCNGAPAESDGTVEFSRR